MTSDISEGLRYVGGDREDGVRGSGLDGRLTL